MLILWLVGSLELLTGTDCQGCLTDSLVDRVHHQYRPQLSLAVHACGPPGFSNRFSSLSKDEASPMMWNMSASLLPWNAMADSSVVSQRPSDFRAELPRKCRACYTCNGRSIETFCMALTQVIGAFVCPCGRLDRGISRCI